MRRVTAGLGSLVVAAGFATTFALSAGAAPQEGLRGQPARAVSDDVPNATEDEAPRAARGRDQEGDRGQAARRSKRGASEVVKVGRGRPRRRAQPAQDQYVELAREKTDKIFVVLAEFGNQRDPAYPDQDTDPNTPGPTRFDGPLHNQIPEPDRTKDNKTIWQADYSREHYQNLYFGTSKASDSLKRWYERQSSGRYSVDGTVTDWVKVPYNEARYGRSNGFPCPGSICANSYDLIRDALNAWVDSPEGEGQDRRADRRDPEVL